MNEILKIALIIGAALAVVVIAVVIICLSRKKKAQPLRGKDRELVAENSKAIEALVILAKDNYAIIEDLKDLQEKLKYLIPSNDDKIYDYDKTIKNKIGDLRIVLTKSDGEPVKKAEDILTDIKLAIADRNTKL